MSTRRRWAAWVIVFLALVALGVFGKYLVTQKGIRNRLETALARMDREHPGWRLADLQAAREHVPDAENAALVVQSVRKRKGSTRLPYPDWDKRSPNAGLLPREVEQVEAGLTPLAVALDEARSLEKLDRGRFTIDYPLDMSQIGYGKIDEVRDVIHLLQLDATLRAGRNDLSGAVQNCVGSLNAARAIGDEPYGIAQIIRASCVVISCRTLEWVLGQGEPSPEVLGAAQATLEKESRFRGFDVAVRGELAISSQYLEAAAEGKVDLELEGPLRKKYLGILELDAIRDGHADMLDFYKRLLERTSLPPHERAAQLKSILHGFDHDNSKSVLARMLVLLGGALGKQEESDRSRLARVRITIAGLAAERYRRANDKWPESVEELGKLVAADALIDPNDGKRLRIKRETDGILIYSVGKDGVDNGGMIQRADSFRTDGDVGFRLFDPRERGKPAPPEEPPPP